MASSRDHVSSGGVWRPPPARLQNAWTDKAAERSVSVPQFSKNQRQSQSIEVLVSSTAAVSPGGVVGFSNPALLPTTNGEALRDLVLTRDNPVAFKWGVATEGIPANTVSKVVRMGYAWSIVNITDVAHGWADIDQGVLTSAESGYAKIESTHVSIGSQWALLLLGFADASATNTTPGMSQGEIDCLCQILKDINVELVEAGEDAVDLSCLCAENPCALCETQEEPAIALVPFETVQTMVYSNNGGADSPYLQSLRTLWNNNRIAPLRHTDTNLNGGPEGFCEWVGELWTDSTKQDGWKFRLTLAGSSSDDTELNLRIIMVNGGTELVKFIFIPTMDPSWQTPSGTGFPMSTLTLDFKDAGSFFSTDPNGGNSATLTMNGGVGVTIATLNP